MPRLVWCGHFVFGVSCGLPIYKTLYCVVLKQSAFTLQVFKDHMIDGETLPLLSEEHLLDTLGLKLGPALKVRSQVWRQGLMKGDYCVFTVFLLGVKIKGTKC